ncbi:phosphatase PAP2 family protein [Leptothrix discophora]|uniref:Phosphatase PAP2 family protein n=1 Tax=Leptothrix discophora TaxID=89 RepID=A0ABT9FZB7_LEPDI|nr:phosphatase PAP2 family protein [Leptothrix discophora]MDP4299572.1 phosphatase PAP2 family protein [Leptothrix discophora]
MTTATLPRDVARRDLVSTAVAALLLLAWDLSGLDLRVASFFGDASGFPLRDAWWTRGLLHEGGRSLAMLVLLLMVVDAVRPTLHRPPAGPTRARRWRWIGATLACLVIVPGIKRISPTSCPWDLSVFGGVAQHISHWRFGLADGGGGHCFPSGHAVAAFAFLSLHFLWREHQPALARRLLLAVLVAGTLFGFGQLARGAHFPSHTLWSAWLCWTTCVIWAAVLRWLDGRRP